MADFKKSRVVEYASPAANRTIRPGFRLALVLSTPGGILALARLGQLVGVRLPSFLCPIEAVVVLSFLLSVPFAIVAFFAFLVREPTAYRWYHVSCLLINAVMFFLFFYVVFNTRMP